LRIKYFQNKAE